MPTRLSPGGQAGAQRSSNGPSALVSPAPRPLVAPAVRLPVRSRSPPSHAARRHPVASSILITHILYCSLRLQGTTHAPFRPLLRLHHTVPWWRQRAARARLPQRQRQRPALSVQVQQLGASLPASPNLDHRLKTCRNPRHQCAKLAGRNSRSEDMISGQVRMESTIRVRMSVTNYN